MFVSIELLYSHFAVCNESVVSNLSETSQLLSDWHAPSNQLFLVSIKSFFQTENILETIVSAPLQRILQPCARNLQMVSEKWIQTSCKVTKLE